MDPFIQDLRYALRRIGKSPGFSALVVLTLALGIGANTAIFSVVNAVLLRPLPYPDPGQLVTIHHHYPSLPLDASVSPGGFRDYRDRTQSFAQVSAATGWGANLTGYGEPIRILGSRVTAQFFSALGVAPAVGRVFTEEEDQPGNHYVAVISHGLWQQQFGADAGIVGRAVSINAEPFTIIGVMPAGFRDFFNREAEIWAPLALTEQQFAEGRTSEWLIPTARLRPGVTLTQAQVEMARFAETLKQETPEQYPANWTLKVVSFEEKATGQIRPALLVLLGAVGFVLLIACANVANLMLARAAGRLKEVAVRMALGARRSQLIRQLLAESTVLALAGGALGAFLAWVGMRALTASLDVPALLGQSVALDTTVLGFTALISIVTGLVFGLAPALQTTRTDVQDTLRDGGRSGSADRSGRLLRRAFVVAEFGLALSLLAGAGLLIKSFSRLQAVDPGFDPENVLTAQIVLPMAKYGNDTARVAFFDDALVRLAAIPGVATVGATVVLPFGGGGWTGSFGIEGYTPADGAPNPWGDQRIVSPEYHRTMRIRLARGRFFTEQDGPGAPRVVIVDEELVRRYLPNTDPIGKRVIFGNPDNPASYHEIVGVVAHTAHEALDAEARVQVYRSYRQQPVPLMSVVMRTQGDPLRFVNALRGAVHAVDPDQPLAQVATMSDLLDRSLGQRRLAMLLLGVFATIGLTLAATGIYGVMSYNVSERAQEMGLRMALGAGRGDVLQIVMRQGMLLAGIGTAVGLLGAMALTRVVRAQLFGVQAVDPQTFIAVTALLIVIGAVATLIPALRATRLDPIDALRQE